MGGGRSWIRGKGLKCGVRLSNKEKGSSVSGVKFDVPPRSTVNPTAKMETVGGGQEEEEEGDVKMGEEREPEEEHKDDGDYEAESSPAERGSREEEG